MRGRVGSRMWQVLIIRFNCKTVGIDWEKYAKGIRIKPLAIHFAKGLYGISLSGNLCKRSEHGE